MNQEIAIREDPSATPICPHCESPVKEIGTRRIRSTLGVRFLYFCLNCKKVLGVTHRKGFWMG